MEVEIGVRYDIGGAGGSEVAAAVAAAFVAFSVAAAAL